MNEKIAAIDVLATKLDAKPFDFDAWKAGALIVLSTIFSEEPEKVELIEKLEYEYSSWNMRDHQGGRQHDPVVMKAKEILEAFKISLSLKKNDSIDNIVSHHITSDDLIRLRNSFNQKNGAEERKTILGQFKKGQLVQIIEDILQNQKSK